MQTHHAPQRISWRGGGGREWRVGRVEEGQTLTGLYPEESSQAKERRVEGGGVGGQPSPPPPLPPPPPPPYLQGSYSFTPSTFIPTPHTCTSQPPGTGSDCYASQGTPRRSRKMTSSPAGIGRPPMSDEKRERISLARCTLGMPWAEVETTFESSQRTGSRIIREFMESGKLSCGDGFALPALILLCTCT